MSIPFVKMSALSPAPPTSAAKVRMQPVVDDLFGAGGSVIWFHRPNTLAKAYFGRDQLRLRWAFRLIMSDQVENLIRFASGVRDMSDPKPYRASAGLPQWLKHIPPEIPVPEGGVINTIKVCMPFLDAMSCGYVIPLRATVRFIMHDAEKLEYQHPEWNQYGPAITYQPSSGYQGTPFERRLVVKFINNWIIETPAGYSTLFVPLLNQSTMPFQMLSGLVDTDRYYRVVHFPAICLMSPGTQCEIPRGAPLVQAIPVKRDAWLAQYDTWDVQRHRQAEAQIRDNAHHYRDQTRVKKDYH